MKSRLLAAASCSLLCTLNASFAVDAEGVNEDRSTVHSLKPYERAGDTSPLDSPGAAEKGFRRAKFPAGFKAGLWAGEPLLANPVAFSFDGKGRMYVAETHRYRTSVLDIRHYMFMLEDDLANRNQADWEKSIKKNFPNDWQKLGVESEVVRLVEDCDGDGKAEKSTVYADGFNSILDGIASGVLARPDGVWLTNIPGLYKLTGSGPDGKAAKKEELFRGFGIRFNYTGHDLHGLIKGPDGRIYFSIGDRGTSAKTKEGGQIDVPDEGAIFRSEEDGSHLELVMRGLRNPQELAFDDYGNLFTCDNDSDQGDRERLVYVLEGGDAGWRIGYQHCPQPAERNPWLAEHMWEPREPAKKQPSWILSPIINLPDGPSGLVHYPGTGLPDSYNGCFFLACYKGSSLTSQVAVFKPVPDGAGFKCERAGTFIGNCQATDVDFGPDSRLYVSFWDEGWERTAQGRIMTIGHEESRKVQAAQVAEVQKLLGEGMKEHGSKELVKLMGHKDQRVRLEAQWELVTRRDPHSFLSPILKPAQRDEIDKIWGAESIDGDSAQRMRLHSIWGIEQLARKSGKYEEAVFPLWLATGSKDPETRAQVLRVAGPVLAAFIRSNPPPFASELLAICRDGLKDEFPRARLFAAQSLGRCGSPFDAGLLLDLARREQDKSQEMRHAIVHSLVQLAGRKQEAWEALRTAASDKDASVRMAVLIAAVRLMEKAATMTNGEPWFQNAENVVAGFFEDTDERIAREAVRLVSDRGLETQLPAGSGGLNVMGMHAVRSKDPMTVLRGYNALFRSGGQSNADAVERALDDDETRPSPELCVEALGMLARWHAPPARDRVTGLYRPLTGRNGLGAESAFGDLKKETCESHPSVILQTLETARALKLQNWGHYAEELALRSGLDPAVRVKALRAAADFNAPELPVTLQKAIADPNSAVRIAAAGLLGKADPPAAAKGLEAALAQGTPEDARAAFTELGALMSPEADRIVAEQVTSMIAGKVPAMARLELLEVAAKRNAPGVKEALVKYDASLPKDNLLAKFDACLEGGNAANGLRLFKEHPVAACQRCHMVNKAGGEAGPPLDGIASRKDRRYMLESILLPNAQIAESFRMVICNMKDGTVKSGVLKSETAEAVTIQLPGEAPVSLKPADIASRDSVPSAMLPNMGELLTKREIRDIVEYLASLK
jgi:quinoprotein glucose dehydrogenase